MFNVTGYRTIEDAFAAIRASEREADKRTEPWQRGIKSYDKLVRFWRGGKGGFESDVLTIYAAVARFEGVNPDLGLFGQNWRLVQAFSEVCPHGEYGTVHNSQWHGKLTDDEFHTAEMAGWPSRHPVTPTRGEST